MAKKGTFIDGFERHAKDSPVLEGYLEVTIEDRVSMDGSERVKMNTYKPDQLHGFPANQGLPSSGAEFPNRRGRK
jgi:hypothetical protein